MNYFQGTVDDSARNLSYTVFTAYNLFHLIVLTENVNEGKTFDNIDVKKGIYIE